MAESQPLLGSNPLTVHEKGRHTPLFPTLTEDICQQDLTQTGNQSGGGPLPYQQGDFQPHQLIGWVSGQPSYSASSIQPQTSGNSQSGGQANVLPPPSLSEDQARKALLLYISSACCWRAGPAERMVIKDIVPSSTFCYKLETFTESRVMRTVSVPYKGQPITLIATRTTPDPWDIRVRETSLFKNSKQEVEIPNTVSIKSCHACYGKGFRKCSDCNGRGGDKCTMCNGGKNNRGHRNDRDCFSCDGFGRQPCHWCNGNGSKKCSTCKGTSQLRTSIKVTVTRTNNTDIVVGEGTGIPNSLILNSIGRVVLKEELSRVNPVIHFQDQSINNASRQLIAKHKKFAPEKKIIKQRQSVNLVPISQVRCEHKGELFHYFVFGFDNKVYAPDYPAQCCCTIL
ncbi:Protein SSUH2-like [Holothuria leucospilota]|uniref:Protein SSUH2-like n=1 Tax=Holothuria leucospilota TaxID=206669 RepID=A0A9Q1CKX1_HOLLE|nr:Protein SSUH2-like [Holothuria leucospilota]